MGKQLTKKPLTTALKAVKSDAARKAAKTISPKRAAFVRLAEGRGEKAVDAIRLIGNLSNTQNYEYTDADITKIFGAIEAEIAASRARFKASTQMRDRKPLQLVKAA